MKKFLRITTLVLLIFTALNASVAGVLFIIDPSGQMMGMTVAYIKDSPFATFLIPGIVLLLVNGVLNFMVSFFLIGNRPFYAVMVIIQGVLLSGWIVVQVILVDDISPLHIIMFSIGVVLTLSGYFLMLDRRRHTK